MANQFSHGYVRLGIRRHQPPVSAGSLFSTSPKFPDRERPRTESATPIMEGRGPPSPLLRHPCRSRSTPSRQVTGLFPIPDVKTASRAVGPPLNCTTNHCARYTESGPLSSAAGWRRFPRARPGSPGIRTVLVAHCLSQQREDCGGKSEPADPPPPRYQRSSSRPELSVLRPPLRPPTHTGRLFTFCPSLSIH